MKFAHIADCHLGAWRQPELQQLNLEAFEKTIDYCIANKVDFILLAGDLFDIAIPSIDILKNVASKLRQLSEKNIPCYIIPGSHDYSVSGKSIISVFDKAGLCINVADKEVIKDNIFISGLAGKKGSLEQKEIKEKQKKLTEKAEDFEGFSILMLHTSISEMLPPALQFPGMLALSLKDLPSGFDYYALGHIHNNKIIESGNKLAAYPSALFPTNFSELEKQNTVNFFIIETNNGGNAKIAKENIKQISLKLKPVINLTIDASDETPASLKEKVLNEFENNKNNLGDAVVTLRIAGILKRGKPSEVDFQSIEESASKLGAYFLLRNTNKFDSKEFELKIETTSSESVEELEEASILAAVKDQAITDDDKKMLLPLLKVFNIKKIEGEAQTTFISRLTEETINFLDFKEVWKNEYKK